MYFFFIYSGFPKYNPSPNPNCPRRLCPHVQIPLAVEPSTLWRYNTKLKTMRMKRIEHGNFNIFCFFFAKTTLLFFFGISEDCSKPERESSECELRGGIIGKEENVEELLAFCDELDARVKTALSQRKRVLQQLSKAN